MSLPVKHKLNRKHSSYLHLCIPLIVCYNLTASSNSKVLNALLLRSFEKDIFMFANNLMEWGERLLLMLAVHMVSELFN